MTKLICVLVASIHLAGCATLNTLPYTETVEKQPIRAGEEVTLWTKKDGIYYLSVTSATSDEICGKEGCFRTDSIESVSRWEYSVSEALTKTAKVALLVGAVALSILPIGIVGVR